MVWSSIGIGLSYRSAAYEKVCAFLIRLYRAWDRKTLWVIDLLLTLEP